MDIRLMREFLILARTENYLEAAELLFVSQPTLSRHIMTLENELGVPLFDKQLNAASSLDLVRAVPVTPACRTHISLAYLKNEELSENARNFLAMYKETLA